MPTNLPRTQVLLQPEIHADVQTLAKHNRRSSSAMCAELIEQALKLPKYRAQIEEAVIQVPTKEDPRQAIPQVQRRVVAMEKKEREDSKYVEQLNPERLQELQQLLNALEVLNKS